MRFQRFRIRLLPLMIAGLLSTGAAQAGDAARPKAAAPIAQQQAAREEIDRLTRRIEELSRQLGEDGGVRVIVRRLDGSEAPEAFMPHRDGRPGETRIERIHVGDGAYGRPGLGIVLAPNPAAAGVRIAAVTPDSPAMKAGLRTGDVLMSVDGKKISGSGVQAVDQARGLLGDLKQDQVVKLGYAREGKTGTASVKADSIRRVMAFNRGEDRPFLIQVPEGRIGMLPPDVEMDIERFGPMKDCGPGKDDCKLPALMEAFRWQGLNLASIDAGLGRYFGTDHGVLVVSNSDELKGLQSGDVIQKVAGSEAKSPRDVMRALRDRKEGEQVKLDVLRDRKPTSVMLTVPKARALPFMAPPPPAPPAPPAAPAPPPPPAAAFAPSGDSGPVVVTVQEVRTVDADGNEHVVVHTTPAL